MITEKIIHLAEKTMPAEKKLIKLMSHKRIRLPVLAVIAAAVSAIVIAAEFQSHGGSYGILFYIVYCLLVYTAMVCISEFFISIFGFSTAGIIIYTTLSYVPFTFLLAYAAVYYQFGIDPYNPTNSFDKSAVNSIVINMIPLIAALLFSRFVLHKKANKKANSDKPLH